MLKTKLIKVNLQGQFYHLLLPITRIGSTEWQEISTRSAPDKVIFLISCLYLLRPFPIFNVCSIFPLLHCRLPLSNPSWLHSSRQSLCNPHSPLLTHDVHILTHDSPPQIHPYQYDNIWYTSLHMISTSLHMISRHLKHPTHECQSTQYTWWQHNYTLHMMVTHRYTLHMTATPLHYTLHTASYHGTTQYLLHILPGPFTPS